ncbi:Ribonuclease H domain [Macleaya cordata]|uniref:Ribonuclease H domain n=1 Tax=Macleaya cordata TaxID=56857 RepID=A0A200PYU4_MACCD|nr:Ribonuclease H domain [Macleaya cordata]
MVSYFCKLVFNAFFYHVWAERNRRVFTNKSLMIITDSKINRKLLDRWGIHATYVIHRPIGYHSVRSPEDTIMVNTNGSLNNSRAGIVALLRDSNGDAIGVVAGQVKPSSIAVNELQAIEAGLALVLRHRFCKVCIGTDSKTALSYLLSVEKKLPWRAQRSWNNIMKMMPSFEYFNAFHIIRQTNRAADCLARLRPAVELIKFTLSSFVQDLKDIIFDDRRGKVYFH